MKVHIGFATLLMMVTASMSAIAQEAPSVKEKSSINSSMFLNNHASRILPSISLYQGSAPSTPQPNRPEGKLKSNDSTILFNVTKPTITPVIPAEGQSNGTAVIIAPGGGYYLLSIEEEGMRQARWLADRGFTAFVLKYRTAPVDPKTFSDAWSHLLTQVTTPGSDVYKIVNFEPAVADGAMAIRTLRSQASYWGIDPKRIVFMGFSAGAFTTIRLATARNIADRPDYAVPVYPSLETVTVPKDAPPMFGAIALDDGLFKNRGFGLLTAWQASGRPFEFHVYERGGHAFGTGLPGTTTMGWMNDFYHWAVMHGLTNPKK